MGAGLAATIWGPMHRDPSDREQLGTLEGLPCLRNLPSFVAEGLR